MRVRTATVSAESDRVLLAVDRSEFLALVGPAESPRGRLLGPYEASSNG